MSLVYAGVLSHAPGIVGRADLVKNTQKRDEFYAALENQRREIEQSGAEVLMVIAAEHFASFFMNNMPAYCIGIAEVYEGPLEDPKWLGIDRQTIPGAPDLGRRITNEIMQTVDVAYSEEWKFDHGIMVPLHFLTPRYDVPVIPLNINCQGPPLSPLHRAWAFGTAIRRACDSVSEKIAVVGTGGISHWPATPDSGKINEDWDRRFLGQLMNQDRDALLHTRTSRRTWTPARAASRSGRISPPPPPEGRARCTSTPPSCRYSPSDARLLRSMLPAERLSHPGRTGDKANPTLARLWRSGSGQSTGQLPPSLSGGIPP